MFDFSKFTATGTVGGSLDFENKTVTIIANRNNWYPGATFAELCPNIEIGKTYTINADTTNPDSLKQVYFDNVNVYWLFGESLTITEEILNSHIAFYNNGLSSEENIVSQIMVNEGSTALPYEPYTGGAPSPSPDYPQEIVSAGKYNEETRKYEREVSVGGSQLFNASVFDGMEKSGVSVSVDNGVITASGMSETSIWIQSANFSEEDFKKLKSGNIYVKNYKSSDCNYECSIYIDNTAVNEGNSPRNIPEGYLETNPDNVYFYISIQAGVELKGSCKPMIYQDGDGTYEPYRTPQTVTLTSDRPLTKWDRLEKRNGQWGWVYKSKIVEYTGQEDGWKARSLTIHSFEILILPDICKEGMSNYFSNITSPEIDNKTGIYTKQSGVLIFTSMSISTLDKWKNWLTEKSDGGVPMRVAYETEEEAFVPLSASEQEQMNDLTTFNPTSVFTNDIEAEMEVIYYTKEEDFGNYADPKTEIGQLYKALSGASLSYPRPRTRVGHLLYKILEPGYELPFGMPLSRVEGYLFDLIDGTEYTKNNIPKSDHEVLLKELLGWGKDREVDLHNEVNYWLNQVVSNQALLMQLLGGGKHGILL